MHYSRNRQMYYFRVTIDRVGFLLFSFAACSEVNQHSSRTTKKRKVYHTRRIYLLELEVNCYYNYFKKTNSIKLPQSDCSWENKGNTNSSSSSSKLKGIPYTRNEVCKPKNHQEEHWEHKLTIPSRSVLSICLLVKLHRLEYIIQGHHESEFPCRLDPAQEIQYGSLPLGFRNYKSNMNEG